MLVWIFGIEDVVAQNLSDRDAVGDLAGHHYEVARLYRVGELIELCGEVPEPVPPPVTASSLWRFSGSRSAAAS